MCLGAGPFHLGYQYRSIGLINLKNGLIKGLLSPTSRPLQMNWLSKFKACLGFGTQ